MYILMFILGAVCGMLGVGVVMASSRKNELQDAYEKGREDERGSILEKVESHFGGSNNG